MPSLTLDHLSDDLIAALSMRARQNHRSPEAEARAILEERITHRRTRVRRGRVRRNRSTALAAAAGDPSNGPPAPIAELADLELPETYRRSLRRAVEILTGLGCSEVYLFGSLAHGEFDADSDVDLAVRGCPKREYFRIMGKLARELKRPVDLLDLDSEDPFARHLEQGRELIRIG